MTDSSKSNTPSNDRSTPPASSHANTHKKTKQSLAEFLADKSFGEINWADDDFDPSSIAVPIFNNNNRHYHDNLTYQSNSHSEFGHHRHSDYQFHHGSIPDSSMGPNSPPYIVKLTNIPSYFRLTDIEDLFHSRFLKYLKLKVFWEINFELLNISPDPLEALNHHKKVAFVELNSPQDLNKVLNWRDLYLDNGMGRVIAMLGNFSDFKIYNDLHQRVSEDDDPSFPFSQKKINVRRPINQSSSNGPYQTRTSFHPTHDHIHGGFNNQHNQTHINNQLNNDFPSFQQANQEQQQQPVPQPRRKSNPFGSAKPVDTLSKELQLENKLQDLEINKTTFRTLGHDSKFFPIPKHHQHLFDETKTETETNPDHLPIQQTQQPTAARASTTHKPAPAPTTHQRATQPEFRPAPQPQTSAWNLTNTSATILQPEQDSNHKSYSQVASPQSGTLDLNRPSSGAGSNMFMTKKSTKKEEGDSKRKVILKKKIVNEKRRTPEVKSPVSNKDVQINTFNKSGSVNEDAKKPQLSKGQPTPVSSASPTKQEQLSKETPKLLQDSPNLQASSQRSQLRPSRSKRSSPSKSPIEPATPKLEIAPELKLDQPQEQRPTTCLRQPRPLRPQSPSRPRSLSPSKNQAHPNPPSSPHKLSPEEFQKELEVNQSKNFHVDVKSGMKVYHNATFVKKKDEPTEKRQDATQKTESKGVVEVKSVKEGEVIEAPAEPELKTTTDKNELAKYETTKPRSKRSGKPKSRNGSKPDITFTKSSTAEHRTNEAHTSVPPSSPLPNDDELAVVAKGVATDVKTSKPKPKRSKKFKDSKPEPTLEEVKNSETTVTESNTASETDLSKAIKSKPVKPKGRRVSKDPQDKIAQQVEAKQEEESKESDTNNKTNLNSRRKKSKPVKTENKAESAVVAPSNEISQHDKLADSEKPPTDTTTTANTTTETVRPHRNGRGGFRGGRGGRGGFRGRGGFTNVSRVYNKGDGGAVANKASE